MQHQAYEEEISNLIQKEPIEKSSKIISLCPTLDHNRILRVDGRINAVKDVSKEMKSPIILDGTHVYSKLLIASYHQKFHHGYHMNVINEVRQKYWITRLRNAVRSVVEDCPYCKLRRAQPMVQRMDDLPPARLAHHTRPFTYCRIDYFGPMLVKIGRRHEKRWGVLFTCLSVRAVHVELASSLNTDSAILAIRRMSARRGQPLELYSDCGTNFRGADVELCRAIQEIDGSKQEEYAAKNGITWKFNPPAAPHMGGSWERLVRSVKTSLKTILKEQALSEEVLSTVLNEAEHVINSRPLTHVPIDLNEPEALTPNHFLIGLSSGSPVPGRFELADKCSRKQWRVAQYLSDCFWKRWVREYLPILLPRKIWKREPPSIHVGDIVMIVDKRFSRNTWLRGIVEQTHAGVDNRIRVVSVRTIRGMLKRPITSLIRLTKST